jgi:hypothetical protein
VSFVYRPLLVEQRDAIDQVTYKQGGAKGAKACASAMAQQIKKWDVTGANGSDVEIKTENCLKLRPMVFDKLWAVIAGRIPNDLRPGSAPADEDQYINDLMNGPKTPEVNSKNS